MINLYVDDARTPMFVDDIPDPFWVVCRTAESARIILEAGIVNNLSLDHDLGEGWSGYDLVKFMEENNIWPSGTITLHTANPVGRSNMAAALRKNNKDFIG